MAIHAGVADKLRDYPKGMHIKDLAPLVQMDEAKLCRILRALSARHCFQEGTSMKWTAPPHCRGLLISTLQLMSIPSPTIDSLSRS